MPSSPTASTVRPTLPCPWGPLFCGARASLDALCLTSAAGGKPGARGLNLLIRKDGRTINLGGKTSVAVSPGVSAVARAAC